MRFTGRIHHQFGHRFGRVVGQFERLRGFALGVSGLALALAVSACTNNLLSNANLLGLGATTGTTSQVFTISNVLQDQSDPSGMIDILGDGSGAMGTYCYTSGGDSGAGEDGVGTSQGAAANSGQTGTSDCGCTYSWTDPETGSTGSVNVNTAYHESNMIECPYAMEFFPSDVTTINVSLYLVAEDVEPATNLLTLNLGNGQGTGVSLTDASNYVQVSRYQCRDLQSIPYLSGIGGSPGNGNAIYDPILSEDPELTYPLDFYTTNLGATYAAYIQNSAAIYDWDCPGNPNDPNYGNNYTIYSVGADSHGSDEIYPTTGSTFDRSNFYVSKTEAGVFTIPLNSYIAPTMISGSANIGGPAGYGAAPVVIDSDNETCPSVSIPSGFHWAKLWLFRADLPDRHYAVSTEVQQIGAVACNPVAYFGGVNTDPVFTDCQGTCHDLTGGCTEYCTGSSTAPCTQAGGNKLADRVLAGAGLPNAASPDPMCVDMNRGTAVNGSATSGAGGTMNGTANDQDAAYATFGYGTDLWIPKEYTIPTNDGAGDLESSNASITTSFVDPLDLFGSKGTTKYVPKDEALTSADLDLNNARYDFVFVVTPTTVMATDMENSSNSNNYPYIPYRFPTASDCQSSNPNFPAFSGDCDPSKIINYGLKLHDVSSNGDPPAGDPEESGVFPMCVLQPN